MYIVPLVPNLATSVGVQMNESDIFGITKD